MEKRDVGVSPAMPCGLGRHYKLSVFAPETLQSVISCFSTVAFKIERKKPM
jgi:hypothetical protein